MKATRIVSGLALSLVLASQALAEDAHAIAKRMLDLNVPEYSYATLELDVIEKGGTHEKRILKEYGGGENGLKNAVFVFTSPAAVKDTRILQCEKNNKEDDKWVYLPTLKTVRRLGAGERSKPFIGTELTYNDMSTRKLEDDTHEMISENESVTVTSQQYGPVTYQAWKIRETPVKAKAKSVEYAYRILYIDKATCLPVRIETYSKADKLLKSYSIEHIETTHGIKGVYYLRKSVNVKNEVTGRQTHVFVKDYKFDERIPNSYFTQQFLSTGKAQ